MNTALQVASSPLVVRFLKLFFAFVAVVVLAVMTVRYIDASRDHSFAVVLAEQDAITKAYDDANTHGVALSSNEGQRVAGETWLACAHSRTVTAGRFAVSHPPAAADLDQCEVQAVNHAVSRGYSDAGVRVFLQTVRTSATVAYSTALAESERDEANGKKTGDKNAR